MVSQGGEESFGISWISLAIQEIIHVLWNPKVSHHVYRNTSLVPYPEPNPTYSCPSTLFL
jgi:hypothetical protein